MLGLQPNQVLWMQPRKLFVLMEVHRESLRNQLRLAAQTAIMTGAVYRSYFGKRAKPITDISQLLSFERRESALAGITTEEQYDAIMADLRKKSGL